MSDANRLLFLRIALVAVGLTFIFGVYTLGIVWPSGWTWGHGHSHYLMMIIGVYATLGVFLLIAARDPGAHRSIIWFTIWSSVVHAAIMGAQSIGDAGELTFKLITRTFEGSDFGRSFLLLPRCTPHSKARVRDSRCVFRVNKQGQES